MRAAVIINPIAGTGGRPAIARTRAAQAAAFAAEHRTDADVALTERVGHARELAAAAVASGASVVIAWGGDGTVNEVAGALAFGRTPLGIVPSGSGNGLGRALGIPFDARQAFAVALTGVERVIDAAEFDGRLFFNIAGIGLDARVACRFAAGGLRRRGFLRYLEIAVRELFSYAPDEHAIAVDGDVRCSRALIVAVANARQYGNGATIAPHACIDDGLLDVVVIEDRPALAALLQAPLLFLGQVHRVPGVTIRRGTTVRVTSARPVLYHLDGEPFVGGAAVGGRIRPAALRVRAPLAAPR